MIDSMSTPTLQVRRATVDDIPKLVPLWRQENLPAQELEVGAFVDMHAGGWERWQLTWASPHGTLLMFTQASGATRSMTRRKLNGMMAQGTLRLVSSRPVVDGALDAVARAAWKNTSD